MDLHLLPVMAAALGFMLWLAFFTDDADQLAPEGDEEA